MGSTDDDSVEREIYERALKHGSVPVNRFRLIIVGQDGVGKSCFVDSLLDRPFEKDKPSTDGIAIDLAMKVVKGDEKSWKCCDNYREGQYLSLYFAAAYDKTREQVLSESDQESLSVSLYCDLSVLYL